MFTVYKITCLENGKLYIGYTKLSLKERWWNHIKYTNRGATTKLANAIRKHGKDAFRIEPIVCTPYKSEAIRLEISLIAENHTRENGYNITPGGDGGPTSRAPFSAERRKHMGEVLKGIPKSLEHRAHLRGPRPCIAGKNNPFYGKHHTEETCKKIGNRKYARGKNRHLYGKPTVTSFKSGFLHPRSIPITINGKNYGSISLAAKDLNMTRPKLIRWLKAGKSIPPVQNSLSSLSRPT